MSVSIRLVSEIQKWDNQTADKLVYTFLDKDGKHLRADNKKILPIDEKQYDAVKECVGSYFSKHHSGIFKRVRDIKFRVDSLLIMPLLFPLKM